MSFETTRWSLVVAARSDDSSAARAALAARAYLLASLKHFLANDGARRRARKRGGGITLLPLAFDDAEGRYGIEPREPATPETLYDAHRLRRRFPGAAAPGHRRKRVRPCRHLTMKSGISSGR